MLCLVPGALLAQDPPPAATPADLSTLAPKGFPIVVRVASPERIDAIGKALAPHLKVLPMPAEVHDMLAKGAASPMFLGEIGLGQHKVARDKPIYLAVGPTGRVAIAAIEGGHTRVGSNQALEAPQRGTPTATLEGDLAVHIYAGEAIETHKQDIEGMFQMLPMFVQMYGGAAIPPSMQKMVPPIMDLVKAGIYGVDTLDYALTVNDGWILSEGRLATKKDSGFRAALARAGAPADPGLAGYLPADAVLWVDGMMTPDWPRKELRDYLEAKLGEGGGIFTEMSGPDVHGWGVTTGRFASSIKIVGMAPATVSLFELKEGVDPASVIGKFEVESVNAAMKKQALPMAYKIVKDAAKHGETALHRLEVESDDPMIAAQTAMVQTYFAAEGRHLFFAASPSAEADIKALIDTVRKGASEEDHPHIKAMGRLGRTRNFGVSMNIGALKPFAPMLMMVAPELAQAAAKLPDTLLMSTAVSFVEGDIRWKGDWPLKEILEIVGALEGAGPQGGEQQPPPDEDFD
jgi:hypothetical protein